MTTVEDIVAGVVERLWPLKGSVVEVYGHGDSRYDYIHDVTTDGRVLRVCVSSGWDFRGLHWTDATEAGFLFGGFGVREVSAGVTFAAYASEDDGYLRRPFAVGLDAADVVKMATRVADVSFEVEA